MGLAYNYEHGQTPLTEEEKEGLVIKTITTHGELDEHEQLNIQQAIIWTIKSTFKKDIILTERFIQQLHKKMFNLVWDWAGVFRTSEKNIGVKWINIGVELKVLLDDARYWITNNVYAHEEIAIRFKHRLVSIHCFPNGNGRHSRLMADVMMVHIFGKEPFTWNNSEILQPDDVRKMYIHSLHEADKGNIEPLLLFAKS